ncbi:MAG: Glu/Leu/Phe/Val dehydrogenase family protein, partial [Blastocatellia bacterium]
GRETGGGDPSPLTALGVFRGIQAAAKHKWGSDDLSGKRVAIQGCGNVGYSLAKQLHSAGVKLVVADIDSERAASVGREFSAQLVTPDEIYGATVDVFAPCALGAIINDATIPMLKTEIIAGSANNQLLSDRHGDELERRGILYAPDYVVNAGGIISGGFDFFGWSREKVQTKIMAIYDTTLEVFAIADRDSIPTYKAANRLAEARIAEARLKGAAAKGRQTQREKQQNA